MPVIEERIRVRNKNQITIPKPIAEVRNIAEGREVIAHIDDSRPYEIVLRIVPDTYAGALTDVFEGIDAAKFGEAERVSWE